jgi:hypothetical protein
MRTAILGCAFLMSLFSCSVGLEPHRQPADDLLVFVGRRIEVTQVPPSRDEIILDQIYDARFEVLQVVYGEYDGSEITFRAADHWGAPEFSRYQHGLLYVSRTPERWWHEKYLFHPLFRNDRGDWAGCGGDLARSARWYRLGEVAATPMRFAPEALVFLREPRLAFVEADFPPMHYERRGEQAACKTGASLEKLFDVDRRGILWKRFR